MSQSWAGRAGHLFNSAEFMEVKSMDSGCFVSYCSFSCDSEVLNIFGIAGIACVA